MMFMSEPSIWPEAPAAGHAAGAPPFPAEGILEAGSGTG